jgi:hypothetical protein
MKIESTKKVYLDGKEYIRVFFSETNTFEDIPAQMYSDWKNALGHTESNSCQTLSD